MENEKRLVYLPSQHNSHKTLNFYSPSRLCFSLQAAVSFASSSYFAANRSLPFWRWGRCERLSSARLRLVTNKVSLSSWSSWNWTQISVTHQTGTKTASLQIPILQPKERPRCVNQSNMPTLKSISYVICIQSWGGFTHWHVLIFMCLYNECGAGLCFIC